MEVALISPISMQKFADASGVHLVLPHLLVSQTYRGRYSSPKVESEYRILDNGIAEGEKIMSNYLARLAMSIQADEVVMPDVLRDCDNTIAQSRLFVKMLNAIWPDHSFALAGVIQGTGFSEWLKCFNAYHYLPEFKNVKTLMFPRCMNSSEHDFKERVHFITAMLNSTWYTEAEEERSMEIHCLGACGWIREAKVLSEYPIRSMDTSLPVSLGLDGINIKKDIYIRRQEGFFDIDVRAVDPTLLEVVSDNCRTFAEWAKASLSTL